MANPVGRPLAFTSVEELQKKIDEYFDYCDNRLKRIWKEKTAEEITVSDPEPYTMSGLAYELGLSRQALINYEKRDEFVDAIKRARQRVERDVEMRMNGKDTFTPGLIFNAKNNFGWKDKSETDVTTGGDKIEPIQVIIKDYGVNNNPTTKAAGSDTSE